MPSRFKKEFISAAVSKDEVSKNEVVTIDSLFAVMTNIGASPQKVSRKDMETIFSDINAGGVEQQPPGTISKERMLQLLQK